MRKAPTQEEIRSRCLEVQSNWSEEERISRIADYRLRPGFKDTWTAPVYSLPVDDEALFEEFLHKGDE